MHWLADTFENVMYFLIGLAREELVGSHLARDSKKFADLCFNLFVLHSLILHVRVLYVFSYFINMHSKRKHELLLMN